MVVTDLLLGRTLKGKSLIVLWMISTLSAAVGGAIILEVPRYYLLTMRGVSTEGFIIALEADKHGSVVYGYQTSRDTFEGSGHAGDINAHFDDLRVGQKVRVFYDPGAEDVSCLGEPNKHLSSLLRGNVFIASFPSLFFLVLKMRRRFDLPSPIIRMGKRQQGEEIKE